MSVWIQISPGAREPVYQQIVEQIGDAVARGMLKSGDKLPAVRKLAAELVVNPNTVARAYALLERSGLVATKKGAGTFVSDPRHRQKDIADIHLLTERMDTLIARALNLGMSPQEVRSLFAKRVEAFQSKK
jgi:GntR family transcriptional regulator